MWRFYEADAVTIGLDLDYFWRLTPNQFTKHVEAFNKKQEGRAKDTDALNYLLGKYIGFAVNDPQNYPDSPYLTPRERVIMSDDDMEAAAMRNTIRLGGNITS